MKLVDQSYDILNRMLNDETFTNYNKIDNLKSFIFIVNDCMPNMTLSSDDLKACNDYLETLNNKLKELQGV
jgi:hypothetical protein